MSVDLNIDRFEADENLDFEDQAFRFFDENPPEHRFDTEAARKAFESAFGEVVDRDSYYDYLLVAISSSAADADRKQIETAIGCREGLLAEIREEEGIHLRNAVDELISSLIALRGRLSIGELTNESSGNSGQLSTSERKG